MLGWSFTRLRAALARWIVGLPDAQTRAYRDYVLDGPDDAPMPEGADEEAWVAATLAEYAARRDGAIVAALRIDTFEALSPSAHAIALDDALTRAWLDQQPTNSQNN